VAAVAETDKENRRRENEEERKEKKRKFFGPLFLVALCKYSLHLLEVFGTF